MQWFEKMNRSVICVDDEEGVLESYRRVLQADEDIFSGILDESEGEGLQNETGACSFSFDLVLAKSGEEAVSIVREELAKGNTFAAGFFDVRMPGGIDGYETIKQIREIDQEIYCAVVTAFADRELNQIRALFNASYQDHFLYFKKPFSTMELEQTAIGLVSSWNRKRNENEQIRLRNLAIEKMRFEIEERERAEQEIKKWELIFKHAGWGVAASSDGKTFESMNPAFAKIHGCKIQDLVGKELNTIVHPDSKQRFEENLLKAIELGNYDFESIHLREDGSSFPVQVDLSVIKGENEQVRYVAFNLQDITEQKQTQDLLARGKEEWEEVFNTISEAITIHDMDYNILRANKAAQEILGQDPAQVLIKKCYESYHGTDMPPIVCPSCKTLKDGKTSITEMYEPHLGNYLEIKALPRFNKSNELIGLIHVVNDITQKKLAEKEQNKLQQQLNQSQKMESIGMLAGGVAHDFNNLLSGIIGFSDLVLEELTEDSSIKDYITIINEAGTKAAALTRQLLAFSRKQVLEITRVNLNIVIDNMSKMLRRLIGESITIEVISGSISPVMADAGQIEQILMNLVVNARDAMPNGGKCVIETAEFIMDSKFVKSHPGASEGEYVKISIKDNGGGMPPEVKEKIFEPFYTTKVQGKGTGLGLATVYGIVKQHEGFILVESEVGVGTTFEVFIPPAGKNDLVEKVEKDSMASLKGTATILVVEDDAAVRRLIRDSLQPLGFCVVLASDAEEALKIFATYDKEIHLLLTDVVLPGMNGKELADIVVTEKPKIKVLFMTGYTDETISHHGVLQKGIALLQKPLTRAKLAKKIHEVLSGL